MLLKAVKGIKKYLKKGEKGPRPSSMVLASERSILGLRNRSEERNCPQLIRNTRLRLDNMIKSFEKGTIKVFRGGIPKDEKEKKKALSVPNDVLVNLLIDFLIFGFIAPKEVERDYWDSHEFLVTITFSSLTPESIGEYRKALTVNSNLLNTKENRKRVKFTKDKSPGIVKPPPFTSPKKAPSTRKFKEFYTQNASPARGRSRSRLAPESNIQRTPSPAGDVIRGMRHLSLTNNNSRNTMIIRTKSQSNRKGRDGNDRSRKSIRISVESSRYRSKSYNPPQKR